MGFQRIVGDALIGGISGYVGTLIMDPVTTKAQQMESEQDKKREEEVSPGVAYDIAARKIAGSLGMDLSDEQASAVASGFHYGLGVSAGQLYVVLRRTTPLNPVLAALVTALAIWAGIDEGANAAFGFSAPPADYPLATHLRGLVGHLALGLGTAVAAETLMWSLKSRSA